MEIKGRQIYGKGEERKWGELYKLGKGVVGVFLGGKRSNKDVSWIKRERNEEMERERGVRAGKREGFKDD